jgi:serine/threonine-protein kinase
VLSLVDTVAPLDEWRVAVSGNAVTITGMTQDRALHDRLMAALSGPAMPQALTGEVDIELGPRLLDPELLRPVLAAFADCGDLWLVDAPLAGYPQGARIVVGGQVAQPTTAAALESAIARFAGDRSVAIEARTLNPPICLVEQALPAAPAGGFVFNVLDGASGEPNPEGRFVTGDNPVIEVVVPADVTDGYLYVVVVDVSGNVYHLLPNQFLQDNSVFALRDGQTGPVAAPLTFSKEDAAAAGDARIALEIRGDTPRGDSMLLAIHSKEPLFDGARLREESVAGFVKLLGEFAAPVVSLDSRVVTTE